MRKILVIALLISVCIPVLAAKKVAAPLLGVNENGALVVLNASKKHVYKYSLTNAGTPSQPETVLPSEGLKITSTGTYNIIVSAEAKNGKLLSQTNVCYHIYTLDGQVKSGVTVIASSSDGNAFAPFVVKNTSDVDLTIARGAKGEYWKFDKKNAGGDIQNSLEIGLETSYASRVSFYIKERTGDGAKFKKVYVYYDGKQSGQTGYGIEVPMPTSVSIAGKYAPIWDLGVKGLAGKRVHFRMANGSEASSWSVLEQGFDDF